jgi:hypothetical protein
MLYVLPSTGRSNGYKSTADGVTPHHHAPGPPLHAVDLSILTTAQASAADAGISVAGKLVCLRRVADQLPKIGDELQDLTIELDGTHQLMSAVPDTSRSDHQMIIELRNDVTLWRHDLVATVDRITDYVTDITVGMRDRR